MTNATLSPGPAAAGRGIGPARPVPATAAPRVAVAGLLGTGLLVRRGDPRRSLTAAGPRLSSPSMPVLFCGTAAAGGERFVALAMAVGLELPLAVGLGVLTWWALPRVAGPVR